MSKQYINPSMLTLARESRKFQRQELAEELDISATYVSKLESVPTNLNEDLLKKLEKVLKYPEAFYFQQEEILGHNLSYRTREKANSREIHAISASCNILRIHAQKLFDFAGLQVADYRLKENDPIKAAIELRKKWKLPKGPVQNMTEILEKHFIAHLSFDFDTDKVDGRTSFTLKNQPIIFTNSKTTGDRQRFTLAYELGNMVMLNNPDKLFSVDLGHESNLFAAEFLMPEAEIIKDFKNEINLPLLAELKKKWKVSMIALLHRAHDLEVVSDRQKTYILQQFTAQDWRKHEPQQLNVPLEQPRLIKNLMAQYRVRKRITITKLAKEFNLFEEEFLKLYS